eukprot:6193655-Amphidinium_carterae.1
MTCLYASSLYTHPSFKDALPERFRIGVPRRIQKRHKILFRNHLHLPAQNFITPSPASEQNTTTLQNTERT